MSKAVSIIDLIRRYTELEKAGAVYASTRAGADDPRYDAILDEVCALEKRIIATRVKAKADIAAKRRFVSKLIRDGAIDPGDLGALVQMTLLDAERAAAA
jgi:hypothetical protein